MVQRAANGDATHYLTKLYQKRLSNGAIVKHYLFNGQMVARRDSSLIFFLTDHLGSTVTTLNSSGTKLADLRYNPWGQERCSWQNTATMYRYTGQRYDSDLGLYDYQARYYDAKIGRFISADPIVANQTNPQNFSRYTYALNSPILYTDPTGYRVCESADNICSPDEPSPGTVDPAPSGEGAAARREQLANEFMDQVGSSEWLLAELDFMKWIWNSGRLDSPWWSVVNGYLLMSRFAALDVLNSGFDPATLTLDPGVGEWIDFINDPTEQNFWRAHNTALREGVRRADAMGLRQRETVSEQEVTQTVLDNVYHIGDKCAAGSGFSCSISNRTFLSAGTLTYPHHYPALPSYAATMGRYNGTAGGLAVAVVDFVAWQFISGYGTGCNRSFTACEGP